MPAQLNVALVTVHPDHMAPSMLRLVDTLIVVGREPQVTLDAFARGRGEELSSCPNTRMIARRRGWCLLGSPPVWFRVSEPEGDRRRHQRKYSEGELGEDISFYFRGPGGTPQPRAQNLELFMQLADGVDDETWQFHLQRHDVSEWFRAVIKDESLATEAADVEARDDLSPDESRARIREAIQRRYTTSAGRSS